MLKPLCLFFIISPIVDGTTRITLVNNAAYIPLNWANVLSYSGSCEECLCYGFFSNISINYDAINCYKNNQTCLLFTSYVSQSLIRINLNSNFLLKQSESIQTTNGVPPSVTTSTFQCYKPQWNSTGITFVSSGTNLNQVNRLYGVFIAANSDVLYIADAGNNRILKWLPGSTSGILVAGGQGPGSNSTQLTGPVVVYVDKKENVYVSDTGNIRIQYFSNGSSVGVTIIGVGTSEAINNTFGSMFGLGVDLANNVYVSEYNYARVRKWSPNATYGLLVAGNGISGDSLDKLHTPTAFYVDPITGTLYVPNQDGHCVTKWLPGSSYGIVVAGTCGVSGSNETLLNNPRCVTFDTYGNMYIIDGVNGGRVLMFCPDSLIGIPIVTSGLSNPISIAVDKYLNIYVSDWTINCIFKYPLL